MQSINKSSQNLFRMYSESDCTHPFCCYHHFPPWSRRPSPHWLSLLFPRGLFSTCQPEWSFKTLTQGPPHVMPLLWIFPDFLDTQSKPRIFSRSKGHLQVPLCSNICCLCLCWLWSSFTPCLRAAQTLQTTSSPTALPQWFPSLPSGLDHLTSLKYDFFSEVLFNEWMNEWCSLS